ncbi:MAG: hypothetical protein LIP02_03685 [Bacteroidales bacterium]|nr:hypothetical protein [Bacteroidales bacterium]
MCVTDGTFSRHVDENDYLYTDTVSNSKDIHDLHAYLQSQCRVKERACL